MKPKETAKDKYVFDDQCFRVYLMQISSLGILLFVLDSTKARFT